MKRMRSWWLAAAACAVLAAALLLPQRFLQQKLDRVAETEFSVDGAELDMEEAVTLMERLRLAAVGEFIAQNTGDDAGALTAQTQQWLLDAQSVIPQPIRPYIDLSGEVFAESGWILDTASGTVFSAIRASLHHTPFIDMIILLDAQTGRLLHLEMLFYQESDYLILLQDLPDCLEDAGGWRQQAADYYGLTANAFRPEDSLVKQWYSTAEPSELGLRAGGCRRKCGHLWLSARRCAGDGDRAGLVRQLTQRPACGKMGEISDTDTRSRRCGGRKERTMIEYVTIDQAAELDAFVLRQPNCHFMQTSAWGRVKEGWGWTGILCRDEKGEIIGSMAILEHRIRHMHTGFLYAPRGPIFRDGDYATLEALVDAMRALAEKRGDYMIRIDPMLEETDTAFLDEVRRLGFTVNQASDFSLFQPRMCYVLDLQGFTPESLLAYYNKTKRYDIRRAERNGVTVRLGDVSDIPVFYRMMLATAAKNGFTARPQQYYAHFLEALGPMAKLYLAEKDGVIIAASITAELGNRVWHMYACSDRAYQADFPNELIQWQMQRDALEGGYRYFDFRGVEGYPVPENPYYGLHHYKQGFGAQFHAYVGQCDRVLHPMRAKLVHTLQKIFVRE